MLINRNGGLKMGGMSVNYKNDKEGLINADINGWGFKFKKIFDNYLFFLL